MNRWRRLVAVAIAAAFVAAAAVLLLARAARPPEPQPFRFPAGAPGAAPTVEVDASERARLDLLLQGLGKTPARDAIPAR